MVCPPSIHLDANNYKDPFVFNPWRWNGQELHVGSKKFIAFGGGSRLCAGADFAKVQMAIFLHHLVTKYRWEVIKEGKILRKPGLTFGKGLRIQIFDNEGE
ncbi:hypothetical protein ACH5RR_001276 [Cinchona calisaya]|uniref:Cytochrome P450 n=1 Tax=Cinchona calisaya TaxID=153742 RepID=A0ABD3B315_9GENT